MRGQVRRCGLTVALASTLAFAALGPAGAANGDAALGNWAGGVCSGVAHWLTTVGTPPAPDPSGDQLLAARRAVSDIVNDGHSWMLYSVKVPPPVPNGKKLGRHIRKELTAAVDEAQRAADLLAGPTGSSPDTLASAQDHLIQSHDMVVATMHR